jgi:hypothetical protein
MDEKRSVLLVMLIALVAGGASLATPWWSLSFNTINRNDNPPSESSVRADFYGDRANVFTRLGTTETQKTYSYAVDQDRSQLGPLGGVAGVMETTYLAVIVLLALLLLALFLALFGDRLRLPSATPQLLLAIAALISLFNLVSLPYAIAAASGEGFIGMRVGTESNIETRVTRSPGAAYIAALVQFLCIGTLLYIARYGVPRLPRRGVQPAQPAPTAPGAPLGYTPTTFVPPPPPDQPAPMNPPPAQAPPPHSAPPPPAVNPPPPPRRSVLDEGHDVIPPAPPAG